MPATLQTSEQTSGNNSWQYFQKTTFLASRRYLKNSKAGDGYFIFLWKNMAQTVLKMCNVDDFLIVFFICNFDIVALLIAFCRNLNFLFSSCVMLSKASTVQWKYKSIQILLGLCTIFNYLLVASAYLLS